MEGSLFIIEFNRLLEMLLGFFEALLGEADGSKIIEGIGVFRIQANGALEGRRGLLVICQLGIGNPEPVENIFGWS